MIKTVPHCNSWLPALLPSCLHLEFFKKIPFLKKRKCKQLKEDSFPDLQLFLFSESPLQCTPTRKNSSTSRFRPSHLQTYADSTDLGMGPARCPELLNRSSAGCKVGSVGCTAYDFSVWYFWPFCSIVHGTALCLCVSVTFPRLNSPRCFTGAELYLLFSQGYLLHVDKQNVIAYLYVCNYSL